MGRGASERGRGGKLPRRTSHLLFPGRARPRARPRACAPRRSGGRRLRSGHRHFCRRHHLSRSRDQAQQRCLRRAREKGRGGLVWEQYISCHVDGEARASTASVGGEGESLGLLARWLCAETQEWPGGAAREEGREGPGAHGGRCVSPRLAHDCLRTEDEIAQVKAVYSGGQS